MHSPDSWQQPNSTQSPVSFSGPSASLQIQPGMSPCQGFGSSSRAQASHVALAEPICLLSPSPSLGSHPLHSPLLSPVLPQNRAQYIALSPGMSELTELVGSAHSELQPEARVELAELVSSVQASAVSMAYLGLPAVISHLLPLWCMALSTGRRGAGEDLHVLSVLLLGSCTSLGCELCRTYVFGSVSVRQHEQTMLILATYSAV